jgi:hypothetical protein
MMFVRAYCRMGGGDSSVGIANGYGLDGPGIESTCLRVLNTIHAGFY